MRSKIRRLVNKYLYRVILLLGIMIFSFAIFSCSEESTDTFTNPVWDGQDPFLTKYNNNYYYCESIAGEGIAVWKSDKMTERQIKKIVWQPPEEGWNTSEIWAPELHRINQKWYIYYAADSGENKDHRMGVLESTGDDPQGEYIDKGQLYTGDDIENRTDSKWAIDGTVLQHNGELYFIWSGWKAYNDNQYLYIAHMQNPWTIDSKRIQLANNDDYDWERVSPDQRGLNEAPQIIKNEGEIYIIYSCSGSWQPTYKLGQLSIDMEQDVMEGSNWKKESQPVFQGTEEVHGVGHATFVKSPDNTEDWIIYHSKIDTTPGWERNVRLQEFGWHKDGSPDFGKPVKTGVPLLVPSGE